GFALGTIRVLMIAPRLGELPAVLLEAPVMLILSWLACGASIRAFGVRGRGPGLVMGAAAFGLLMCAGFARSLLAFDRSRAEIVGAFAAPAGAIGLASQVAFGLFPLLRSAGSQ